MSGARLPPVHPQFPRPAPNAEDAPFWASCREHQLRIQRCDDCGTFRYHPRPRCPQCRSANATWTAVRGTGTVASFTLCFPPVLPAFADRAPYNAVVVQLDEGPFMVSNLVDIDNDAIDVGLPVQVTYVDLDDDLTLPQFRVVEAHS
jgi:uncharacterized OB-fold protein